jgi:hypothetical protein
MTGHHFEYNAFEQGGSGIAGSQGAVALTVS